jgi:hypothetical protein
VPRAVLACGRVGDDGDVMATQPVRPALRLLSGQATCMAASCCTCMAWRIIPPRASVAVLAPCVLAHVPVGAETCRARRRLVVGIPLMGNWSEMQPTSRRLNVLLVWVLTRVFSPPCPESLP